VTFANVDLAAYRLLQHPRELDVVVAPNLFGDVLADLGGVLLGSRGLSFSGNFAAGGASVYQTNHGAAHDLAGKDRANPVGQVLSLAMLLRESFGLAAEAALVERAVAEVYRLGFRTDDVAEAGCRAIGTREMAERIAAAVLDLAAQFTDSRAVAQVG
jgi:3-isopropylmalate dehydrogenase